MYPSKGSGAYGQQQYSGQQAYGQIPGAADMGAQHAMASRQSMMGATQEADLSGYRAHSAQGAQYGGPYAAVYGSAALSSAHQAGGVGGKGAASSGIQSQYPSALPESSKFSSAALGSNLGMNNDDYVSASSRGYAQKGDPFSAVKGSDYSSMDRRHYGDQAAYHGRDLQNDPARRYADSVSIGQQHLADVHGHMDQQSLLRQQQILKAQSLSGSDMRQAEYLVARAAAPIHHGSQEYSSYGGRMDVDPRSLPILGNPPYGGQHAASILGGALGRNVDDLYSQASSTSVYGVGLPPGRDYVSGKGLHGQSLESDYQALSRGHPSLGVSIADERKDDRTAYRRELERDEERRRELIREKEKEREREERERRRERERERERLLERRERERERDRMRASDARRERTPPRSRDRRGSSLLKDERTRRASPRRASPRRVSPRREALLRHRSPVKEKKREYMCKVVPFRLIDIERDYLSLNRRYPRLFISPECLKVVLHWPKQSLHLSLHTPVSFEHEYVEVDNKGDEKALVSSYELSRMKHRNTVWNAKVILMSGMSSGALNEMCSYRSSDEKIIHFNNILRFAILKKDHSFMAIGGPWNEAIDGGDPSIEDSSLIQTARRYLKDITQLDLRNCQHWNRFLEIHYDRIGEDGLFSHKEITVIFVPDLSESLPSLDTWRSLWLAHKKNVAGRERQLAAKDKKSAGKKESGQEKVTAEGSAGKGTKVAKTGSDGPIPEDETDKVKADDTQNSSKESNKKDAVDQIGKGHLPDEKLTENAEGAGKEGKSDGKKITDGANANLTADKQMPVKRKITKKVVKRKVVRKKATEATVEDAAAKLDDKVDVKDDGDPQSKQEADVKEEDKAEPANVKTFTRKKVVKKVHAGKSAQKVENTDSSANQTEKKPEIETDNQDEKIIKKERDEAATLQETGVKTTGKKKIIRRVIKRKVSRTGEKNVAAIKEEVGDEDETVASQKASKGEANVDKAGKNANAAVGTTNSKDKVISDEAKTLTEEKEKTEKESKKENKSNEQNFKSEKSVPKSSPEHEAAKDKGSKKDDHGSKKERTKYEKENKSKDARRDRNQKSSEEGMEKGKSEEPPQHPGLFLQTKRSKGSKVRSMSLSLDGLLDYNDKDIEESTFELSLFAESLNELLQYQMGCRLLSFLEKLRKRFILKKNQRKRQRDEKSEKQNEENSLKRPKVADESAGQNESPKSGKKDTPDKSHDEIMVEAGPAAEQESKIETKSDDDNDDVEDPEENKSDADNENDNGDEEEEEDPEEMIEDDQEMNDVAPSSDGVQEDKNSAKTDDLKAETEKVTAEEDNGEKTTSNNNIEPMDEKPGKEKKEDDKRSGTANSDFVKGDVVDKEVLQAFRYFDHNRVGYIKVEDLRCLLHNLGKFISHRDVKELVQSALFESNTARDNRIFYKKLVKLTDL